MKFSLRLGGALLLVLVLFTLGMSNIAHAQSYTVSGPEGRAGSWEFFMPLTYNPSTTINSQGGSSVDLDPTWGFGIGFGYNFNDHFQMNGLFSWSARNYTAKAVQSDGTTRSYSNTTYLSTFSVNGIYYFLKGKINPFVSGGLGITYIDTSIQTGPSNGTCWWDPWYGYVCSTYYPTKTQSDFTYGFGLGVRFDLNPKFSLQPSYNKAWVDINNASGTPDFDIWRLDFIFRMM
jgi:opacity protein-like surface antigen